MSYQNTFSTADGKKKVKPNMKQAKQMCAEAERSRKNRSDFHINRIQNTFPKEYTYLIIDKTLKYHFHFITVKPCSV